MGPEIVNSREQRLSALAADIALALAKHETVSGMLDACSRAVLEHLDVALVRIWIFNETTEELELMASSGLYTNLNGSRSRIKLGQYKVGHIAQSRSPYHTNDVLNDPLISDKEWVAREGMHAFAGHPLMIRDNLVGVLAVFSRRPMDDYVVEALDAAATTIAIGVNRKKTEEALQVSERRYRAVFDTAPDGIITLNELGEVESANRAAHAMFRYVDGALIGAQIVDIMPDFFGLSTHNFDEHRLMTGEKKIFGAGRELVGHRLDGSTFPLELALSVTNLGRTSIFTAIVREITERKAIENQLRDSEHTFGQIANAIRDVLWITAPDFRKHAYISPAYEEVWGRSTEELFDNPLRFMDYIHERDRENCIRWVQESGSAPAPSEIEFRIIRPDGSIRWLWVRAFPIFDEFNNIVQICGVTTDNTDRKEAQKRANEFYSMVSHELRTPLTSIRAALGLIEGGLTGGASEETMELVNIARSESDRLIRLINDILDLRKMEAGKLELRIDELIPSEVSSSTIAAMRGMAKEHGIVLKTDIAEDRQFLGDRDRVIQVLTNLLSNAIKFSAPESDVCLRVLAGSTESMVRFCVVDKGPGIPPNKMDKLFGLFQQLDSSDSRARGGTGLGLAISKAIVERLGGAIGLDSAVGVGSIFWFELPAVTSICPLGPGGAPIRDESDRETIREFLNEYARSLPGWLGELQQWLDVAQRTKESKLLNNCLLRVRKIRGSAEPCGFPEIAETMRNVEFALSNIIDDSGSNHDSDWQCIKMSLANMACDAAIDRNAD